MTKRVLLWVVTVALLMMSATTGWAKPAPAPNVPAKAGQVTALLPVAKIVRGTGKAATTNDAKKGDELVWNDLIKTEKGGRARITLTDQSILSLGSQAELRIVKHDARAQQTTLQMAYGRVRAQVANITRDGGSFELRTPTAVAGVIGTDFGVDSSPTGGDTFVCIAGATQISNSDPNVHGAVQCSAGQTTTVMPGKAPSTPVPASLQQLQQLIEDTEPAIISSIAPAAAMPGTNFDATVAGTKLGKVSSVSVTGGSGVSVNLKSATDTSVNLHVAIEAGATAGPRTITLTKQEGASSATVFTVLGTPIGDPKKAYLDTLEQLRTTGVGGLGSFLTGAQQAADQVSQQITTANQSLPKPLDLTPFATSLNQQYSVLSGDLKTGTGAIDKAAQEAANTFAGLYDAAFQSLLTRDPGGNPDSTFNTALTAAFTQANTILQTALQTTQSSLNGSVQQYGNQLNTIQQTWSQNINAAFQEQQVGPLPKVSALERIVELGGVASFDASSSSASNTGASITNYQWTLCSGNYQPQGFGQLLPTTAAACNGIQGFASTSPEFQISTCSLQPGNYYARLAVTDSNNSVSQMDVRLSVLAPSYPTPGGTVRELANAYTSLQLSQFLRWFDSAQFNGYTPLSENIRQTMQSLSSMAINLRLSQENVTCNDATVRADWQQNYSFIGDSSVYSQTEQLSVRLQRSPGKGWFITDFQGDNGKVQGVPGPQTTDSAAPDLAIDTTTIDGRPVNPGAPLQVASGPHTVNVNITNNGSAPLALGVLLPMTITLQDSNGATVTTIDTFNGTVPTPLNVGSTVSVPATLNFPASATNLSIQVQVNPSCNPPEKTCGAPNNSAYPLVLGLPDFTASFVPTATVNGIAGRPFSLQAVNVTPSPYPAPLTVAYSGLPAGLSAGSPAGNTTNITGSFIVGTATGTGSSNVTATASAAGTTKNVAGSATISIGPEIAVTAQSAPSFTTGGSAQNLVLNVTGGVYPVTVSLALPNGFTTTSGTVTNGFATQVLNAAGPVTYSLTAGNNSATGNQNFTVIATDAGIAASNTPAGNKSFAFPYSVTGLPDLQFGNVQIPPALQMGATVTAQVPVVNNGSVAAAAGWSVVVNINGTQAGTTTGPSIAAGQTATVTLNLTIPQIGNPPVSTAVPGTIVVNGNGAIQESNTNNNTFNANLTLADFGLTLAPTIATGVVGRTFNLLAVDVQPTPYAIPTVVGYNGLPNGIAASTVANGNGLIGDRLVGAPAAAGRSSITAFGSNNGVTHNATGTLSLIVLDEITVSQVSAVSLTTGGAAQNLVLNVAGGVYPVTVALTLPTGITTTSGTINGNVSTQTISAPGPVTFALTATNTATVGAGNFNVLATDAGVSASGVPAGNVAVSLPYTVAGLADLVPGLLTATAGQQGATYTETIVVTNSGNATAAAGWDVKVQLNGVTVGTATGPSIAAGGQATVPVTVVIPTNFGTPPVDQVINGQVVVNGNGAISESNSSNNTSAYSQRIVDFVLTSTPPASTTGVVGRSYAANQVVSLNPTPYPTNVTVSYGSLPAGLAGNGTGGGLLLPNLVGTPTAAGTSSVTTSASADGITHSAATPISITINPEISLTQTATPALTAGGPAQNLSLNVTGGIYPVALKLALPTGITTTSGSISAGISTITLTGPGTATWSLSADFTAATGGLQANVVATDGGNPLTNTPAGNVLLAANYSVNGNASFSVTGYTVSGHTAPFTQANAFQVGESTQFQVSVRNNGNISPSGNVTVSLDCGDSSLCPQPLTMTVAAPASGATTVVTVPVDFTSFGVKTYNGTIALSTDVAGAGITGSPVAVPFDVVDFTIGGASLSPFQNLPIGGTAQLGVSVAVQVPSGSPFGVLITPAPTDSALVFNPSSQVTLGAQVLFPLTIGASAISGQGTVRFNATNHGITKFVDVPYVAFTATLTSTTLFVNDFSNPLQVPVAVGATAPASYPTVGLKLNGNFDHTQGSAAIIVQQPGCGSFSAALFPSTAIPNDTIDLPIYASAGNTCPAGTQVVLNAAIPQTFPPVTVPVYTLFVTPSGLPQLAVQSATPARDLSSQPWLSGEPLDWTVVVQNTGSAASAGNETVTVYANNAAVGQGTLPGAIPSGQTATISIHTVAPDYPESQSVSSFVNVRVSVQNDNKGDLNPGNGDLFQSVNFANWGIGVISGNGQSDQTPVDLSPTVTTDSTTQIGIKSPSSFYSGLSVSLVAGSYSSGQLSAPGFSPNSITGASSSFVTVSFPGATQPLNGYYFVQVIAQMKDGATVTAQRQVTIHVRMSNQAKSPAGITLASDRSNIAPVGSCSAPACQTVQINGPLPEAFTLTASVNSCSAGNGCPGTADISFTDSFMTVTTPQVSTVQVTSPGNTLPVRVKAADNPDGSINAGSAKVNVSITAIQANFFGGARTPTPEPVGSYQFEMNFNIADLDVSSSACNHVAPQNPSATQFVVTWYPINGFNIPNVSWEWEDSNHVPVGASPLAFDVSAGSSTFNGNGYNQLTFNVTNPTTGIDGLQTYYFAFTVSNGIATATKYFPFDFDLSRSQTFCAIASGSRGGAAGTRIRGSWGKAGLSAPNVAALSAARTAANGKLPDLRISASDISFTPSIPKQGDTVAVRFRISNIGDGDATGVPVALQVRGATVVSDTFDIPAGKTVLGGLNWVNAHTAGPANSGTTNATAKSDAVAARRAMRLARLNIDPTAQVDTVAHGTGRLGLMQAQIVIDPQKTITQKSTLAKSAPLAHFGVRDTNAQIAADAAVNEQRVLLEIPEGGCGGLKFAFGAGTCSGTTDLTFTVEDLAKASYKLESYNGVADLGIGNSSTANASYGSQAVGQNGHTYAVQLNGGKPGIVTVTAVRNPEQLSEAAKRLFRQGKAIKVVQSLGGTTGAPDTGDTASGGSQPMVYFDIVYQAQ